MENQCVVRELVFCKLSPCTHHSEREYVLSTSYADFWVYPKIFLSMLVYVSNRTSDRERFALNLMAPAPRPGSGQRICSVRWMRCGLEVSAAVTRVAGLRSNSPPAADHGIPITVGRGDPAMRGSVAKPHRRDDAHVTSAHAPKRSAGSNEHIPIAVFRQIGSGVNVCRWTVLQGKTCSASHMTF